MSLVNYIEKLHDDNEQEKTEQEIGENVNERSIDVHSSNTNVMMRISEIMTEELQTATSKLKKRQIPRQQRNQSRRHQSMRRWDERNGETNLQRNHETERVHTRGVEESENKSDTQNKRWCGRCKKLPTDVPVVSVVLTVHDHTVQQIKSTTRPKTSGRSGGIQKLIPDNRSPCDVQNDWPEMPQVGNENVDSNDRVHEGFRLHHAQINLESTQFLRYQSRVHPPIEENFQRSEGICTDRCREWHVRDFKGNQTRWPVVKLALQHGSAESIGRRHSTLAKLKRCGNLLEWQQSWLHHEPEICKKLDSGSMQGRRKFSATKENRDRWHDSRNIDMRRKHAILGPDDYFPATGDDRN